jgi:hypothetical protein
MAAMLRRLPALAGLALWPGSVQNSPGTGHSLGWSSETSGRCGRGLPQAGALVVTGAAPAAVGQRPQARPGGSISRLISRSGIGWCP